MKTTINKAIITAALGLSLLLSAGTANAGGGNFWGSFAGGALGTVAANIAMQPRQYDGGRMIVVQDDGYRYERQPVCAEYHRPNFVGTDEYGDPVYRDGVDVRCR